MDIEEIGDIKVVGKRDTTANTVVKDNDKPLGDETKKKGR